MNSAKPPGVSVSLPPSRCAIASTARSSNCRSWLTSSTAPGNFSRYCSSHNVASRSRWLVGSSRSSISGAENSTAASATRIRQPPGKTVHRPRLRLGHESEAREDSRCPRRRGVCLDGQQPVMQLRHPLRRHRRIICLGQQRRAFGVGAQQHHFQRRRVAARRLLRDIAPAASARRAGCCRHRAATRRRSASATLTCRRRCARSARPAARGPPSGWPAPAGSARRCCKTRHPESTRSCAGFSGPRGGCPPRATRLCRATA